MAKQISRRDFLKGSVAGAAGLAAAGLFGCASGADTTTAAPATSAAATRASETQAPETTASETQAPQALSVSFDKEVDFLVVGYGLAGEAAALEANDIDPNASVCILEKMPEAGAGGNSIASGQTVIIPAPDDLDTFKRYLTACSNPNPIADEYLDFLATEFAGQGGWIQATVAAVGYELGYVGGGPISWGSLVTEFPDLDGASFKGCSGHVRKAGSTFEYGGVWRGFDLAVRARDNIELCFNTSFTSLIQDESGAVLGVTAVADGGSEIRIKANKGVLLACGGFENNLQMQRDFHGMDMVYTGGTPGNTGDAIQVLMAAGAKMWHMNNQTQSGGFWLGIKVPDYEAVFMRNFSMAGTSWLEVAADDQRFYDEAGAYHRQHMKYKEYGHYVDLPHDRALPVHLIFDEKTRTAGAIVTKWLSWPITTEGYVWSDDNSAEIEKGWIVKADTIEELAGKLGRDPEALKATIDRYNEMASSQKDTDFGRNPETMSPLDSAPFYAVGIAPALVATTGGAERNPKAQVLKWNGEPIPNLYEAGELGSFVSNLYQNGVFLAEAIATGRAAADTAFGGRSQVTAELLMQKEEYDIAGKADGSYEQLIKGNHGEYTLQVEVAGGQITGLEIVNGRDNMFMDDTQLETFFNEVISGQSVEVDAISGATLDSNNLIDALKALFKK